MSGYVHMMCTSHSYLNNIHWFSQGTGVW